MPNPNPNNENQMTEAKKNLFMYEHQMDVIHFDDPTLEEQHRRFTEALHELSQETDRYYTKDAQGNYPIMDEADFAEFDDLYRQVYGAVATLKTELQKEGKALTHNDVLWKSVYGGLVDSLQDVLGQDFQHLHSVQRSGNETLPALIEQARIHSYDVSGQPLEKVGAGLSSRLAITIPGANGDVRGFFTESVHSTEEAEIERLKQEAIAKNPKMEDLLADFDQEYYLDDLALDDLEDGVFGEYQAFPGTVRDLFNDEDSLSLMNEVYEDFTDYRRQLNKIHNKYKVMRDAKLGENDKVDLKNCAMSTVADLLDMKDLLAHAEPVEITYTENGETKTLKGSFMQYAEGEDVGRQVPGKGLLQPDAPVDAETASLKQQMADLQVLDYICGNVDRHMGNMFYQLDETDKAHPKLVGIKGIDNDASFTLSSDQKNHMTTPKDMRVIRKKTADLVEGLTPDMLKTMLRNYNLSQEQLEAVWTRTQKLQEAIQAGKDFYRDKAEDALDMSHLRVLDDAQFENVKLASLQPSMNEMHSMNYFMRVADLTGNTIYDRTEAEKSKMKKDAFDAHSAFFTFADGMPDLQKTLQKADSVFRKKPEYQAVLDSMAVLAQPDNSPIMLRKKGDIERKMEQIDQGLRAAEAYLNRKQADYSREMQAARSKGEKAVRQCIEKYKGEKSADAQRVRAVDAFRKKLTAWKEAGNKALQMKVELAKLMALQGDAAYADRIRHQAGGKKKVQVSLNSLQMKYDKQAPAEEKKTVFRKSVPTKEIRHNNSLG